MHAYPHLTIGYGAGHCDSGEIAAALRTALPTERTEVRVDAVHLVQVRQDAPGHGYHLAAPAVTVSLGGARPTLRSGGAR
jgi:2'-5' RNA ligase